METMECPRHKGREMDKILSDPETCDKCGQPVPQVTLAFECPFDHPGRKRFDIDGNEIVEQKEEELQPTQPTRLAPGEEPGRRAVNVAARGPAVTPAAPAPAVPPTAAEEVFVTPASPRPPEP